MTEWCLSFRPHTCLSAEAWAAWATFAASLLAALAAALAVYAAFRVAGTQARIAESNRIEDDKRQRAQSLAVARDTIDDIETALSLALDCNNQQRLMFLMDRVRASIAALDECARTCTAPDASTSIRRALDIAKDAYLELVTPDPTFPRHEKRATYSANLKAQKASIQRLM